MKNVINLNKFRKRKVREQKEKQAETNRRLHGRTSAERAREARQKQTLHERVDQARLSPTLPAADEESDAKDD